MARVIASFTIIPLGTATPSVSRYVANVLNVFDSLKLKYQLTPMCTIIEGEEEEIFKAIVEIKKKLFEMGLKRIVYSLNVDERIDKPLTMSGKIESVQKHRR